MRQLTIDPEFRDKIPPLSEDEFSKLEQNILEDGEVREPLVVWRNTIIDGHHRYKIVQKHPEIPFKVKQMDFADKWAAIVWMCRNQLGRRNITDEQKTTLIGEAYKAQKMTHGGNTSREHDDTGRFTSSRQIGDLRKEKTRDVIARDFGVGTRTVERAENFVDGLNEAEKISPGIKEAVLSRTVKAPKSVISEIRNAPEEKKREAVEAIKKGDTDTAKAILRPIPKKEPEAEAPPFLPGDLEELINAAANNLDFALKQHLVLVHRDILDTAEGRKAAVKSIDRVIDVATKYKNMIRRIEESGTEN